MALSECLNEIGRHAEALETVDKALEFRGLSVRALVAKADAAGHLGNFTLEVEALEHALQLEPEHPTLVRDLGWANFRLKERATARMQIDEALALDPGDSLAWWMRALMRVEEGDREAMSDYDLALELASDSSDILACRGMSLHRLGKTRQALSELTRLLQDRPDHQSALRYRGKIRRCLGDLPGCIEDYRRAVALEPDEDLVFQLEEAEEELYSEPFRTPDSRGQHKAAAGRPREARTRAARRHRPRSRELDQCSEGPRSALRVGPASFAGPASH